MLRTANVRGISLLARYSAAHQSALRRVADSSVSRRQRLRRRPQAPVPDRGSPTTAGHPSRPELVL
jgi:hypothetical protein